MEICIHDMQQVVHKLVVYTYTLSPVCADVRYVQYLAALRPRLLKGFKLKQPLQSALLLRQVTDWATASFWARAADGCCQQSAVSSHLAEVAICQLLSQTCQVPYG